MYIHQHKFSIFPFILCIICVYQYCLEKLTFIRFELIPKNYIQNKIVSILKVQVDKDFILSNSSHNMCLEMEIFFRKWRHIHKIYHSFQILYIIYYQIIYNQQLKCSHLLYQPDYFHKHEINFQTPPKPVFFKNSRFY